MSRVLSFGGPSKEAVIEAFRAIIADAAVRIFVLPVEEEECLAYREFDGLLEDALASLVEGHSGSVQVQSRGLGSLLAGVYRPSFANERLADWSASVEGEALDAESAFNDLQAVKGLTYVTLSQDECLDFDAAHVTEGNFPWSDWRLQAGAVRDRKGLWVIRRGGIRQMSP